MKIGGRGHYDLLKKWTKSLLPLKWCLSWVKKLSLFVVPDKSHAVFIRTSGRIFLCWFLWTMFFLSFWTQFSFRPCFSLHSPCGFYSDHVFSKYATLINALVSFLWFLSGPRFSSRVPWGFYKEWRVYFLPQWFLFRLWLYKKYSWCFYYARVHNLAP